MDEKGTLEIIEILKIIRKRILILIIIPLVLAVISGLVNFCYLKPVYEAKVSVIVGVNDSYKIDPSEVNMYQGILNTCIQIAKSADVAENAATKLNNGTSAGELQGGFNVQAQSGTQMLIMSFDSSSPKEAVDKVQAMTQAFIDEESRLLSNAKVQIMDSAKTPTSPIKPNKLKNILLSFMIGVVLAIGLILFLEMLDNSIKNEEDVEKYLEIPVVGIIPKH